MLDIFCYDIMAIIYDNLENKDLTNLCLVNFKNHKNIFKFILNLLNNLNKFTSYEEFQNFFQSYSHLLFPKFIFLIESYYFSTNITNFDYNFNYFYDQKNKFISSNKFIKYIIYIQSELHFQNLLPKILYFVETYNCPCINNKNINNSTNNLSMFEKNEHYHECLRCHTKFRTKQNQLLCGMCIMKVCISSFK